MSPHSSTSSGSAASTARLSTHRLSRSSSSSDESYCSITSDVDLRDNFYNSELRARGPYLCSLPARIMSIDSHWYEHYTQLMNESAALCRMISDLLETQGMLRATVEITGRQFKVDPEHHALPTILVLASKREQPVGRDWCAISRAIYRWMSGRFPGINVEILDEDEAQTSKCYPVMGTDLIYHKWGDISGAILQQLDIRQWTSLQCCRYGIQREPPRNPVTILVTVCYPAEGWFLSSQTKTQAILASFGETTFAVVFLQNEFKKLIEFSRLAELDDTTLSEQALPGGKLRDENS